MEFPQWLFHKYLDWQGELGQRKSLTAFAGYVGVSQPQMTAYLKGDYLPKGENLGKLAVALGVEVYDVMGMPRPRPEESPLERWASEMLAEPEVAEFMKRIYGMPDEQRTRMLDFAAKILARLYRVPDSEERRKWMQRLIDFKGAGGRKNPVFKKKKPV